MFDRLVASATPSQHRTTHSAGSVALHAVLVLAALGATTGTQVQQPLRISDTAVFFVPALRPGEPPQDPAAPPEAIIGAPSVADRLGTELPQDILPADLPRVSVGPRAVDPRVFSGSGQAGGMSADGAPGLARDSLHTGVFLSTEVDDPARLVDVPTPRYPPALARLGVEGHVELAYIIHAEGRVEPASITVLSATHEEFVQPTIVAIRQARFRPGFRDGEPVRQLVHQSIRFRAPAYPSVRRRYPTAGSVMSTSGRAGSVSSLCRSCAM